MAVYGEGSFQALHESMAEKTPVDKRGWKHPAPNFERLPARWPEPDGCEERLFRPEFFRKFL
jgi:hypothetical protein